MKKEKLIYVLNEYFALKILFTLKRNSLLSIMKYFTCVCTIYCKDIYIWIYCVYNA